MNYTDQELIYNYLDNKLTDIQSRHFEERMSDESFLNEFLEYIKDEEVIQRALNEIPEDILDFKKPVPFAARLIKFTAAAALIVFGFIFYEMNNYEANLTVYKGNIFIDRNGDKISLEKNAKIKIGDVLETDDGTCTIKYKDKTTLRLEPYSRIKINTQRGAKFIQLLNGSVYSSVTKQEKDKAMIVRSIPGQAIVLGTQFTATAIKSAMKLDVIKGAVQLENNTGQKAIVRAGEYAISRNNVPVEVLKTPVQNEIKEEEEKFYKWLSYSTKIRNDKDLVVYYDFQNLETDSRFLLNKSVASKNKDLKGKISNAIPVQGRWIHKEALYFTGNSYIDCGNPKELNIDGYLTVFLWVKTLGFQNYQETFISKGDSAWRLARFQNSEDTEMAGTGLVPNQWTVAKKKIDDGKWHLLTGVYDGSKISLYIDGKLESQAVSTGKIQLNNMSVAIGTNLKSDNRYFKGWIDEAGIFKRALSSVEIKHMYEQGKH